MPGPRFKRFFRGQSRALHLLRESYAPVDERKNSNGSTPAALHALRCGFFKLDGSMWPLFVGDGNTQSDVEAERRISSRQVTLTERKMSHSGSPRGAGVTRHYCHFGTMTCCGMEGARRCTLISYAELGFN